MDGSKGAPGHLPPRLRAVVWSRALLALGFTGDWGALDRAWLWQASLQKAVGPWWPLLGDAGHPPALPQPSASQETFPRVPPKALRPGQARGWEPGCLCL